MYRKCVQSSSLREVATQSRGYLEGRYGDLTIDQYSYMIYLEVRKIKASMNPTVLMMELRKEIPEDMEYGLVKALCEDHDRVLHLAIILPYEEYEESQYGVVSIFDFENGTGVFKKEISPKQFLDDYHLVLDIVNEVGATTMDYKPLMN